MLSYVAFTQAYVLRSDLNQFIVVDEVEGLFQAHNNRWRQANCDIGGRGADVGLLLLFAYIDDHVHRARVESNDHALVYMCSRLDKGVTALLSIVQSISHSDTGLRCDQSPHAGGSDFAQPGFVIYQQATHSAITLSQGQERIAEPDQSPCWNVILQANITGAIIGHVSAPGLTCRQCLSEDANKGVTSIDYQVLDWLQKAAVFILAGNDFGARYLELVSLTAHGLDEDGEMQFTTTGDDKLVRCAAILYSQADVCLQLSVEASTQLP